MSLLGFVLTVGAVALCVVFLLLVFTLVHRFWSGWRQRRLTTKQLVAEMRIQCLTQNTAAEMITLARREWLHHSITRARHPHNHHD